jgi:hypothetical protein
MKITIYGWRTSQEQRVVVVGRRQQRTWTAEDGSARQAVEVVAEEMDRASGWRRQRRSGDEELQPVASSTSDATSGTRGSMLAFRSVQQGNHRVGEDFLYELKAGQRAAACGGRPWPGGLAAGNCTTVEPLGVFIRDALVGKQTLQLVSQCGRIC